MERDASASRAPNDHRPRPAHACAAAPIASLRKQYLETSIDGFAQFGLSPALHSALLSAGYREPTPIQRAAIPYLMQGRDVLGCAQTGTGKTAAFALPILHRLAAHPRERTRPAITALVLAPTRELASQIEASFVKYGRGTALRTAVIFGGVSKVSQIQALRRGVDILVATPGRLLDLMDQREVDLSQIRVFVLDEADRMLDMGFIHDVRRVIAKLPRKRQTLLFSATMPREIEALAARIMLEPERVAVDPVASVGEPISQGIYFVDTSAKLRLLVTLLRGDAAERALVFTRTKHGANRLADNLARAGVEAAAIHGNKSQSARERALEGFKSGEIRVVVATDIAARGIDIKGLSHVINYDMPVDPESYVHRIGRTGRAGQTGIALSFCAPQERPELMAIERLTRKRIDPIELPADLAHVAQGHSQGHGQGQGRSGQGRSGQGRSTQGRAIQGGSTSRPQPQPIALRERSPERPPTPAAKAPRPGYAPPRRRRGFA